MIDIDNATLSADLRHASQVVRDYFFGVHSREMQAKWMNELETMLEQAADRIETERDAILRFLQARPSVFESSHDMTYVLETIQHGAPGAPKRGTHSERRIRELRLTSVRAKLGDAMLENARQLAARSPGRDPDPRYARRAAILEIRVKTVDRIAKEWGLL